MNYPYFPPPYIDNSHMIEEIEHLKQEIKKIKEQLKELQNKKNNSYLQNDDNLYML